MIIAKYKFNPNTYANYLPVFNSAFTNYTTSDVSNGDGTITRIIESDNLPTLMRFGETSSATDRSKSLLEILDMNTSNLTSMANMFGYCTNLTSIVCNWNTSQVTSMSAMFISCSKLTSLNVSNFNASRVTSMDIMFAGCSSLTQLNVSNWDTSKVTNMEELFRDCSELTSLDISKWNTSKVTNMRYMFLNCYSLTSLDVSNWDTSNITNTESMFEGCSSLRKVNLKYANQSTVSKIHDNLPDRSSTTKGYILSLVNLTSNKNWETLKFSHNEFYLPQPLRKVGDVKDRFYWDYDKGHYCIEQNIIHKILDGSYLWYDSATDSSICWALKCDSKIVLSNAYGIICNNYPSATPEMTYNDIKGISLSSRSSTIFIYNPDFIDSNNRDAFIQWINDNPLEVWYQLETPIIIDLTEMNKKITFDTYLPDTSVKVTNLLLQPYKLLLEDDTVRYKSTIEPSTLYTIQFNCLAKSTTNLTLDLGGSRKTVDPIIGVNHVQITTPSVLASDRLFLIGTGIVIKEVIVNKGEMNQYPKYFDDEQSVGELQEDGTYNITIHTDDYSSRWEEL